MSLHLHTHNIHICIHLVVATVDWPSLYKVNVGADFDNEISF